MKLYSVCDPEFHAYGRIVTGMDGTVREICDTLKDSPLPEATAYVPSWEPLQALPAATEVCEHLFGGLPVQMGYCNGHNTVLNCLEYHRSSEFNVGTEDFILLLARQEEIADGKLDTARVKAFRVPAGVMIECYATTLHYCPCHADPDKGFRVLIALPEGTNLEKPAITPKTSEDQLLWASNKWLLAHPDSSAAAQGAYVGLVGENYNIADQL